MKKKLMIAVSAVLAASAGIFAYLNSESKADDLFSANVEALADEEIGGNYKICYSESVVKVGYTYYDCGPCTKVYDEKGRGRYSKCFK